MDRGNQAAVRTQLVIVNASRQYYAYIFSPCKASLSMHYRRFKTEDGIYFITVNLVDRTSGLLVQNIDALRHVIRTARHRHPFTIIAMVVQPDHLHALWRLPQDDADFPVRWSLIKAAFSRLIPKAEYIRKSRRKKRECGSRCWEHIIRDETDLSRHMDYIHFNPAKHR